MPSYTYTLEDFSPLITYSSGWSQGTSASDGLAYRYSQSSFQATNNAGATAKFSFNGTGVAIYGAKRDNHGLYQVTVDGSASSPLNGLDTGGSFQTILYEVHNLSLGKHDVVVTNLDSNKYLDIDFVTVDGVVGSANSGQTFVNTVQDSDSTFTYLPSSDAWSAAPNNLGTFSGSSGHVTSRSGASVSFTFSVSDGVALYGPLSTDGSPYSVQLDGQAVLNSTTVRDRYWPQALLFQGMNLGEGKHNLQVSYQSTASGQNFAVDYANVYTTSKSGSSSSGSSGLSAGAAAGITTACFVIVGLIGAIVFLLTRKRRQSTPKETLEKPSNSPLMQHDHFAANSQTALGRSNFGSIVSHGNPTFSTAPSSPEMSSGYLPTMASVGHSQGYAEPAPAPAGATRLEWRQSSYDQNLVTVVESQPRRESPVGSQQRLGPNGYPLEKRSRNELAVVSGHDEAGSSDHFAPPGYSQTVQNGGQSYIH